MEPVEPKMAMRFGTKIYFTGGVGVGEWAGVTEGTWGMVSDCGPTRPWLTKKGPLARPFLKARIKQRMMHQNSSYGTEQ